MAFRDIREEWAVVAAEGQPPLGAVRRVGGGTFTAHIENYGEVELNASHVLAAHDGKVVLALEALSPALRDAIGHAHDREEPDEVLDLDD